MTNTASSNRFHINFAAKRIVGSKASFDKAGKGYGPIYEELARLIKQHPDYGFEVVVPQKRSDKPKRTYKGMDISFIRDFLTANGDSITLKQIDNVIAYAESVKAHKYPLVKRVFFKVYDCFDYDKAKTLVDEYRDNLMLVAANELAAIKAEGQAVLEARNKAAEDKSEAIAADLAAAA